VFDAALARRHLDMHFGARNGRLSWSLMARTVLIVVIVVEHDRDAIVLLARTSQQLLAWQSAPSRRHIARRLVPENIRRPRAQGAPV
jgi:hypothetical protein